MGFFIATHMNIFYLETLRNLESISGHHTLKQLSVVHGSTVRSKHVGREAIIRSKQQTHRVGANHIMGVRLSTTELGMQGRMVEVFAYGTAVKD